MSEGAALVAAVLKQSHHLAPQLAQVRASLLSVLSLYSQFPHPPIPLFSSITLICSSLALNSPSATLSRLSPTALLHRLQGERLYPGVVGHLLAAQGTVLGDFPCLRHSSASPRQLRVSLPPSPS